MTPTSEVSAYHIFMLVVTVAYPAFLFAYATYERRRPLRVEFRNPKREHQLELATGGGVLLVSALLATADGKELIDVGVQLPVFMMLSLLCVYAGFYSFAPKHGIAAGGLQLGGGIMPLKNIDGWEGQENCLVVHVKARRRHDYPFDATSRPLVDAAMRQL